MLNLVYSIHLRMVERDDSTIHRNLVFRLKFCECFHLSYMGVSKNNGIPKSSILIGFSIINHPFWGTTIFGNVQISYVIIYIKDQESMTRDAKKHTPCVQQIPWQKSHNWSSETLLQSLYYFSPLKTVPNLNSHIGPEECCFRSLQENFEQKQPLRHCILLFLGVRYIQYILSDVMKITYHPRSHLISQICQVQLSYK